MRQELLALLPQWGPWLLAVSAFLSCMMVPLPTTFLLLTAGALSGTGHLHLPDLLIAAALGATLGDLSAFSLARRLGPWLHRPASRFAPLMARAERFLARRGMMAVFLSRWLITPLGPPVNYVAGAAGLGLPRFLLASVAGEILWATLHLGIGHVFGRQVHRDAAAPMKALALGAVLAVILIGLRALWRRRGSD